MARFVGEHGFERSRIQSNHCQEPENEANVTTEQPVAAADQSPRVRAVL